MELEMLDIIGNVIGVSSLLGIYFIYKYSDALGDGNVGSEK